MQLPGSNDLNVQCLARLFSNTSECYKFFWFQAILVKLEQGNVSFSYDELLDEMIASAWYMVTEYHLNLGPKDNLEELVRYISKSSGMKPAEKKNEILKYLQTCQDKYVRKLKRVLIANVPYRLQSPLIPNFKNKDFEGPTKVKIENINRQKRLIYYFSAYRGLDTEIFMQEEWLVYFLKNQEIIKGWLQYHMILYLQKRNPSVPGIADKLSPPVERKLDLVRKYWRTIMGVQPIYDIYGNKKLSEKELSIDHFVPWSYVAHDEMWNLHPTIKSINSKKGNKLPEWASYFPLLCRQEYIAYQLIWKNNKIQDEFRRCAREHLNNDDIRQRLYQKGLEREQFQNLLEEIILPVYQSARNSGFDYWKYRAVDQ